MKHGEADMADIGAFLAVAEAGGFREAARVTSSSSSALSDAVRRLEARLGVRLLNRTTRSVAPTEAGQRLAERLKPALGEVSAALDVVRRSHGAVALVKSQCTNNVLVPEPDPAGKSVVTEE